MSRYTESGKKKIPPYFESHTQTVTLGMGCFWSPEALFGHLPGVVSTRVGYAGGTTDQPTYRQMGDHSETVEVDFSPALISLEDLLELFWNHHNPVNINDYKGRQYRSLVLCRDKEQEAAALRVAAVRKERGMAEPDTELAPLREFYPAEDRHQKYYLKRFPDAMDKLGTLYTPQELQQSTLAARLNGLAKGYTNLARIKEEIAGWPAAAEHRAAMTELIGRIRW
ncbi:peptide-methionine (S)-S-oxide reductase MsrA [Paenibacillus doosanensis]|uniref:Peptide methionine sulfoxide reductase MsrA n=1 Tax=Paenibacillus konkukensis TaxID=2020716 RepID=A0ABY4RR92_9BACL|nr:MULTISPECIES: peptide-methionine (S)-S-oxide reductase MsrA [Paenibacillus]MCS7459171.1 peptide-methionine (S)-S-oxide reductase MsrA [Paenibacillus doosanensis]UQZ84229.1 Peptide methionine sulfoxide reductase MsrA [Paenibacillus konkukensis]